MFMAHFCAGLVRARLCLVRAGSGCPGALLRVPRPAGSSFTYAEHPDSPILVTWYSSAKCKGNTSQQRAWGVCRSEVKEEVQGFSPGPGDMSGGRYPKPAAGSEKTLPLSYGRKLSSVLKSNRADFIKLGNLCLQKY